MPTYLTTQPPCQHAATRGSGPNSAMLLLFHQSLPAIERSGHHCSTAYIKHVGLKCDRNNISDKVQNIPPTLKRCLKEEVCAKQSIKQWNAVPINL
jgi:hypothetical protein